MTTHIENNNGFNSWYVNYAGKMTIEIYYEPQTTYIASMIVSIVAIITVSLYVIIASIKKVWSRKH